MILSHLLDCIQVAPVAVTRASGTRLYDADGTSYVDFEAGMWCMALGHAHPRVQAAMSRQTEAVSHLGPALSASVVEEAAAALLRRTPHPDGKALFLSSGSEAVEMAMRLSRLITGRARFLSLQRSYLGAFGLSGRDFADTRTEVDFAPCAVCPHSECRADCPNLKDVAPDTYAALVFEPVLASGGIIQPPAKLLQLLAHLVRAAGGLVVVDEVTTGLGRTGAWWGFEHVGVTPDIIACGKGLGNGYPVSAVVLAAAAAEAVEQSGFRYAQSHQNDPLAAATVTAVLGALEDESLIDHAVAMGELLGEQLRDLARRHPAVAAVRGCGLMWGLELQGVSVVGRSLAERVWEQMIERGYILGVKPALSLLRFFPPLVISAEEITAMSGALDQVLTGLTQPAE